MISYRKETVSEAIVPLNQIFPHSRSPLNLFRNLQPGRRRQFLVVRKEHLEDGP